MSKNESIVARLELISSKAKILAEDYRNGRLWDSDLSRGLDDLLREITYTRNDRGSPSHTDWHDDR